MLILRRQGGRVWTNGRKTRRTLPSGIDRQMPQVRRRMPTGPSFGRVAGARVGSDFR